MNTFMNALICENNFKETENGATALKSTNSYVYDLFAFGGAYRNRSLEDTILLFKNAFEEDPDLALKCLFYIGDCRGGQGERLFFRRCFYWICSNYPDIARKNLEHIPYYRRWDDLIYSTRGTVVFDDALFLIKRQLNLDLICKTPSLLAKWLPSENASSKLTKTVANEIRIYLKATHKEYRKLLSELRKKINVLERLMSQNKWDEIEFDKIPSKAGFLYKNAFAKRDFDGRYNEFIQNKSTKVNASVLYPYELVSKVLMNDDSTIGAATLQKYWDCLPNYFNGEKSDILCVVDTSASMKWTNNKIRPLDVAISIGLYCAEKSSGPFKDHYISFSEVPELIKVEGVNFTDKVHRIYNRMINANTNLENVFDLLLDISLKENTKVDDIPKTIVVISDMEIDHGTEISNMDIDYSIELSNISQRNTLMEIIRKNWKSCGLECPRLVYWNVNARNNTILDNGDNISLVSGCSPIIFEQVLKGLSGKELMLDKLLSERYSKIHI